MKRHKRHVHNIDVIWYECKVGSCNYRAKDRGNLRTHMKNVHAIRLGSTNESLYLPGGSGPTRKSETRSKYVKKKGPKPKEPGITMRIKGGVVIIDDPIKGERVKKESPNDVRVRIRNGEVVLDGATGGWAEGLEEGVAVHQDQTVSTAGGSEQVVGGYYPTCTVVPVEEGGGLGGFTVNGGGAAGGKGGVEKEAKAEEDGGVLYLDIDDLL